MEELRLVYRFFVLGFVFESFEWCLVAWDIRFLGTVLNTFSI